MALGRLENEADLRRFLDDYTHEVQSRVQTLWTSGVGGGVTDQHIRDVAGAEIIAGTGISVAYDGTHVTVTNTSPGGGGGAPHALLGPEHFDTQAASPTRGDLIVGKVTNEWGKLPQPLGLGGTGYFLRNQGGASDPTWTVFDSTVRNLFSATYPLQYDASTGAMRVYPFARGGLITTQTAFNVPNVLAIGTSGTYLRSDGADPSWSPVVSADIGDFNEGVDDRVATLLKPGPGIALSYNDPLGQLLITASLASYSDFQAQDAVGNILNDSSTIDFTYTKSARWNTPNWNAFNWNDVAGITAVIKPLSIDNSMISSTAAIDYSKLSLPTRGDLWTRDGSGSKHLAVGSSGTFLRSDGTDPSWQTITDADVPDTITLSNITQITTRSHASLQNLSADDHTQYALLAGRSGGQTLIGGTTGADALTLKGGGTGGVVVDLSAADTHFLNVLWNTNPGAQWPIHVGDGQTITMKVTTGQLAALVVNPAITWGVQPNSIPFQVFNFAPTVTFTATGSRFRKHSIFRVQGNYNVTSGVTINQLGGAAGQNALVGLDMVPTFTDIAGGGSAGATTRPDILGNYSAPSIGAGWTLGAVTSVRVVKPTGTGTITTPVVIDIDDIVTGATVTYTNTPLTLRSLGTTAQMQHAGPVRVGASGAPSTASGLDLQGDLSLQHADLALANGANNDIAIGNKSVIRITGPTGAFNITSLGTPYAGKIVTLVNTTANAMTITNAAGTGTAANRIVTSTNADLVGTGGNQTTVTLVYDATTARWRDIAFRP